MQIAALHQLVYLADPRLRVAQTVHARCYDCKDDMLAALEGPSTLWIPNIAFYDGNAVGLEESFPGRTQVRKFESGWTETFEAKIRASGRPVWWYFNAATGILQPGSQKRYPSLHIDHDCMAHRVIAWMAWDRRIGAVGHWMATYWRGRAGPWQAVPRGERDGGANGDGVLLYPARGAEITGQPRPDGPATSIRLEMLREGGQDHKLLTMAESKLGRAATRHLAQSVHRALDDFPISPAPMRAARYALLKAIS